MKYDFTTILDREGHDALAVDSLPMPDVTVKEGFSKIPMWVADMNFPVLPAIQESIFSRLMNLTLVILRFRMLIMMPLSPGRNHKITCL